MNKSKLAFQQTEQFSIQSIEENRIFPLEAVMTLVSELNRKKIRYCHWKSNSRLDWGLAGRTDLDLLIDPKHEKLFRDILMSLDIKRIIAPPDNQYPGLEHYLGFDEETGRLFHVHVHYNLVLGEQFVKNYRIPLEKQFLDFTRIVYDVKIPVPELEIIILSIRALLKYRDRDVVKDIFSIRSPGIPEHILHEILWLLDQTSSEKIIDTFSSISDFSDGKIILSFLEIVNRAPRSGWKLFRLRSRLRRELRNHQRQNRFAATINYFQSLLKKSKIFSAGKDQRLKFPERGKLIALIGIDGSGKSTLSAELAKWLEWKISAPLYYLGSKQPSVWSDWSYIGFRIFRRSNTILSKWIKADRLLIKIIQRFRQFFLALHYLSVGVDRYKRYKTAKKEVEEGSVIIFDRFPFVSPLDGPEIHLISEGKLFFFTRKLSEIEKRLYRKFDYLDFITVLDVNPEVSIERKPDHSMETIVAKNVALSQLKTDLSKAPEQWNWISIDSDLPIDQVLLNIKAAVWSQL